jgi:glycosyltransferase involved in cell wall biosynthesis
MRVVMFVYDDVTHDARVRREAATLAAAGHDVTIVGRSSDLSDRSIGEERLDGTLVLHVPMPGRWRRPWRIAGAPLRAIARAWGRVRGRSDGGRTISWLVIWRFGTAGWARNAAAAAPAADVAHGHDLSGLLAAAAVSRRDRIPLVYDSHELFLEAGSVATQPGWARAAFASTERRLIRASTAVVTVNRALADELAARYAIPLPTVVHNCPPRWDPPNPRPSLLRAATGIADGVPLLLYHGSFSPHRGLEQLAAAILEPGLERAHAVYLGYGSQRSMLERLAREPRFGGRLHVLDAVDPAVLLDWVAGADIGVVAVQHSTLNHLLSSPNKLFEAIAAGVPVVAMDFPYVHAIVLDDPAGPLGAVCDPADPASIALAIRAILELPEVDRADLRERCLRAARERWNWETESARLVALYADLARQPAAASGSVTKRGTDTSQSA